MRAHACRWHISASGVVGAWPSNQPLEAYNKTIKNNKITVLRSELDKLCHTLLPELVCVDSKLLTGPIDRATGITPSEVVEAAASMKTGDVGELAGARNGRQDRARVFFVNSSGWRMDGPNPKKVDAARMKAYIASVDTARVTSIHDVKEFEAKYMSLHRVLFDATLHLEPGPIPADGAAGAWRCDCKAFWMNAVCSHVLKVKNILGEYDLPRAAQPLPKNKKRGRRSQKNAGPLVRDG